MAESPSELFSDSSFNSSGTSKKINGEYYESLLLKTKQCFSENDIKQIGEGSKVSSWLTTVLKNCETCISECLNIIIIEMENVEFENLKICAYLEDAVCLLQMLSNYIENMIESIAMSCSTMMTFPTTTAHIILRVFTHCKDCEFLYGKHLISVEKQLKDLFLACHELQLTYLMTLEKHFIFDMSKMKEKKIFYEALDINLKISKVIHKLEVKSMAEQWKAYTAICEKHANYLTDTNIYKNCTEVLSTLIESDIKSTIEDDEKSKIGYRSLKVISFTIKILLKIYNIFKIHTSCHQDNLFKLLLSIYVYNGSYLEKMYGKSQQFIDLMNVHVSDPTHTLLTALVNNEQFMNCIFHCDISLLKDKRLLGYIIFLTALMKCILQNKEEVKMTHKNKIIDCVFDCLPYCHVWFNMGLQFKQKEAEGEALYDLHDYLLTHTLALVMTLNGEHLELLEKRMYEALLDVDCYSGLFASKLWVTMTRLSSHQYSVNTLISLCKIYQKLEGYDQFSNSPQRVYLASIVNGIFETLPNDSKLTIYNHFNTLNRQNESLWSCLQIKNLPDADHDILESETTVKLMLNINKLVQSNIDDEDMEKLINIIKLSSTCSFTQLDPNIERSLVDAWSKACPSKQFKVLKEIDPGTMWYYRYISALISLTDNIGNKFKSFGNLVQILHVIAKLIQTGNDVLIMAVSPTFCKLTNRILQYDNNFAFKSILTQTMQYLLQETRTVTRQYALKVIEKDSQHFCLSLMPIDCSNLFNNFNDANEFEKQLEIEANNKYVHKCIENSQCSDTLVDISAKAGNFAIDINDVFSENETDEPVQKKAKVYSEVDAIVSRLEHDVMLLNSLEVNDQSRKRIEDVCNKLKNIIH